MNIDIAIVVAFLALTLIIGLVKGRNVKNIKEFAIGNRDFTTTTLVCTIIATWIGGDYFFIFISESYANGLYFIFACVFGQLVNLLAIGLYLAPRMDEFLGSLSIAEAMGKLYGNNVKLISAIAGCIGSAGIIAAQFKIAGLLFEYSFGLSSAYGIIFGSMIVTTYSAFGGIKSVTFTDVIQFFMFGAVIPTLAFFIFGTLDSTDQMMATLSSNENFNYRKIFDFTTHKSIYYLFLFLGVIMPALDPAIFQRISMAKNVFQARKAFVISAFVYSILLLMISWIGVIAIAIYPNVSANEVAKHVIMDYSYIGLRGLTIAGVIAMIMSTADSYINSTSVLFTHDFCKSAGIKIRNELLTSRIVSLALGAISLILALYSKNLLKLLITTNSFYMPIVSVPFMFSIFGFRSSGKSVLIGMGAGFITVVIWELFLRNDTVDSIIPGMAANLIFLLGSHYILKQHGGWVGIKNYAPVLKIRAQRKAIIDNLIYNINNFNFIRFCINNSPKPSQDNIYVFLGIFSMFATYFSIYTLPQDAKIHYQELVDFIYPSVFFVATLLITYPIWFEQLKNTNLNSVLWIFATFYILICVGFMQVLISNFHQFQLMTFMLNFVVLAILTRWPVALFMIIMGLCTSVYFFTWYSNSTADGLISDLDLGNIQFTVAYIFLFMSTILIAFLKPKQEYHERTEAKVNTLETEVTYLDHKIINLNDTVSHYNERIEDQTKEIDRLGSSAQRILNNVNHELRLPVGNVQNFADMLCNSFEDYTSKQLRMLSNEVYQNSNRLSSMILNMLDLATLDVKKVDLQKKTVNFSELVENRVKICRSIYLDNKPIDFKLTIDPEILLFIDPNYIRQTVDNLVINAINFSKEGKIEVTVKREDQLVALTIEDEGIGIPENDIHDIFIPFKMGSNTESKAQGRGVGLALCKAAIEAHGGTITAESRKKGATFKIMLP